MYVVPNQNWVGYKVVLNQRGRYKAIGMLQVCVNQRGRKIGVQ